MTHPSIPLSWRQAPDHLAALIDAGITNVTLLYSGLATGYSGGESFLAWGIDDVIESNDLSALTTADPNKRWFICLSYEALHADESITCAPAAAIATPAIRLIAYRHLITYDEQCYSCTYQGDAAPPDYLSNTPSNHHAPPNITQLAPAATYREYLAHVGDALEHINAGHFYQVNYTRKIIGATDRPCTITDAFHWFNALHTASPAPYSAFISHNGHYIISSSPECFIEVNAEGTITTRPIKGTAPRDAEVDTLYHSIKDRAENLMIVDLMRNDIARCCIPGSVTVPLLYDIDSFATLHHLSSTITGTLRDDASLTDILQATFPPGSMTGAPKISAMQWIAKHEAYARGIYSGALGWIHGRECALSVVIRTIVAQEHNIEYQVGGGIVSDSNPHAEYEETRTKSRGVCAALGCDVI